MTPKSQHGFSDDVMLYAIVIDHIHDFGSIGSKIIVI